MLIKEYNQLIRWKQIHTEWIKPIQQCKLFNFDCITKEDNKEHNPNWTGTPDHSYRILIDECSGSGKTNALLNLINHEPDIRKLFFGC